MAVVHKLLAFLSAGALTTSLFAFQCSSMNLDGKSFSFANDSTDEDEVGIVTLARSNDQALRDLLSGKYAEKGRGLLVDMFTMTVSGDESELALDFADFSHVALIQKDDECLLHAFDYGTDYEGLDALSDYITIKGQNDDGSYVLGHEFDELFQADIGTMTPVANPQGDKDEL